LKKTLKVGQAIMPKEGKKYPSTSVKLGKRGKKIIDVSIQEDDILPHKKEHISYHLSSEVVFLFY
jgi:hypothetical protein